MLHVSEIYDNFLSQISDYSFLSMSRTRRDVEEELYGYLKSSIRKFSAKCRQDLTITTDEEEERFFVSDLTYEEQDVLVAIMLVEYLKPKVLTSKTLEQRMSDKDFQVYSQANHLREVALTYRLFRAEARNALSKYEYSDIEDWL